MLFLCSALLALAAYALTFITGPASDIGMISFSVFIVFMVIALIFFRIMNHRLHNLPKGARTKGHSTIPVIIYIFVALFLLYDLWYYLLGGKAMMER